MNKLINRWESVAYYLDLYRIFPRVLLAGYGYMAYKVAIWFMGLADATPAQAGFPSVVYGAAPFILNFYMQNGIDWERRRLNLPGPSGPSTTISVANNPPSGG